MKTIDLRSDTVTHPTEAMRKAMHTAEVGDDVFGDDPTVIRLEELSAERLNKEAALFVASGTMGNLVSVLTHCKRGDQIILGDQSHIFLYEQGGSAALGGVHSRTLRNRPDGTLDIGEIEAAINPADVHFPHTRLICIENAWNGRAIPAAYMDKVGTVAGRHHLKMHLDGARLFNAAIALDVAPAKLAEKFDSVQFCFSKGLSCPVGSIICGDREFIAEARRNRKIVGGGMRQVGILAAACIVALEEMIDRLVEDHDNASLLAEGLGQLPGVSIDLDSVETNIVFFDITSGHAAASVAERLKAEGVLVLSSGPNRIRAVTHYGITEKDIKDALAIFGKVLSGTSAVKSR